LQDLTASQSFLTGNVSILAPSVQLSILLLAFLLLSGVSPVVCGVHPRLFSPGAMRLFW